jgi:hypothetical protein
MFNAHLTQVIEVLLVIPHPLHVIHHLVESPPIERDRGSPHLLHNLTHLTYEENLLEDDHRLLEVHGLVDLIVKGFNLIIYRISYALLRAHLCCIRGV